MVISFEKDELPIDLRGDLCSMQQLANFTNDKMCIGDHEAFVSSVKSCQQGPLFHFRVSKLGGTLLTNMSSEMQELRSSAVFARRSEQLVAQIRTALELEVTNEESFLGNAEVFASIAAHVKFLRNAPKIFGNVHDKDDVKTYADFMENTVLRALLAEWHRECAKAAKALAERLASKGTSSGEKVLAADSLNLLDKSMVNLGLVQEQITDARGKECRPRVAGIQSLAR